MAVYLPDGMTYTKDEYRDFLVRHASKTVWCSPFEDERFILHLSRLTKSGGDISTSILFKNCTKLPTRNEYYHVYMVGGNHPFDFHFPQVCGEWIPMTTWCHNNGMNFKMYNNKGIVVPLSMIYYYCEYDGNIVFAVLNDDERIEHLSLDFDDIYIDFRVSQFWTEDTGVSLEYRTFTKSQKYLAVRDRDTLRSYMARPWKRHNRSTNPNGFNNLFIRANIYLNGKPVWNYDKAERLDYLDYVEDGTIMETHLFRISELPFFQSTLDKKNKYAVILTDRDRYGIFRDMMDIIYRDDIEIHLLKIDPTTVTWPDNSNSYNNIEAMRLQPKAVVETGCYYHVNDEDSIRMLTHRSFSLPVDRVNEFIRNLDDNINLDNWYILLHVRTDGLERKLTAEKHELISLQSLSYPHRVAAMTNSPEPVSIWHAAQLEHSSYNYLMRCYLHEITPERVIDAYGYSHTSRALMNPNVSVTKDPNMDYFVVPVGLTDKATVYEYDENGLLLGWYHHLSSTRYLAVNENCVYIEMIPGLGSSRPNWLTNPASVRKQEMVSYRFYLQDDTTGDIKDVTSDKTIVYESDAEYTFVKPKTGDIIYAIPDDSFLSVTRPLNGRSDGVFDFYLSSVDLATMQNIPVENVAVWINGHALVEGIDYIVEFPKVTIISRRYIEHIEFGSADEICVTYRCIGFTDTDFLRRSTRDVGFVMDGRLSYDDTYDAHYSRNLRIVAGGRTLNPNDITFDTEFGEANVDVENALPYQISEHIFPIRGILDTGKTYELYREDIRNQKQISDFLSSRKNMKRRLPNKTLIKQRYPLYSPFMSSIINDILKNPEAYLDYNAKDIMDLEKVAKKYLPLLTSDPAKIGCDVDYTEVHPLPFKFTDKIVIHHRIMVLLEQLAKRYLDAPVALSSWFKVKRTRLGD